MKHYLSLCKSGPDAPNKNKVRGDVRGGGYLKRIITGTDKDGSPQYRYIRSQEELDKWEDRHRKAKPSKKEKKKEDLQEKVGKEHSRSVEQTRKVETEDKPVKKAFVIRESAGS